MKKTVLFMAAAMFLCSCSSISNTASTKGVDSQLINRSSAEMKVSDKRVSYTLVPTKEQRRAGGERALKAAAIHALLEANGNADVLVAPEFEIKKGFNKVHYVKVSGKPASYVNVHPTTQAEANVVNTLKYPQSNNSCCK